jgi:SAM-dependent methyltransferase
VDAEGWDRRYATSELIWTAEPNRFLVEEISGLVPGRALDVAAGEGRNAVWLARQGWEVTAVDFSQVGLDKARQLADRAGVSIDLVCADATVPITGEFDLAVILYLHLPPDERNRAYRNAANTVAPGGTLLIVGHDTANLAHGFGGPQDPAVLFTAAEVVDDLDGTGLAIRRAESVHRRVATDDGVRIAIDALLRAERPA